MLLSSIRCAPKGDVNVMDELDMIRRRFGGHQPGLLGANTSYAVLCPLVRTAAGWEILFEVRAPTLQQGGEVCFPGGQAETGELPAACALRETEEELAIPQTEIHLIGQTDFLYHTRGFLLYPILGELSETGFAVMRPSPAEVEDVFTVPLKFFREVKPEIYTNQVAQRVSADFPYARIGISKNYAWSGGSVDVPVWYWRGRAIWGLTARILREVLTAFS